MNCAEKLLEPTIFKFHVKTTNDKLAKLFTKYFGHMPKMAAMPIYSKKPFQSLLPKKQKANDLVTWYVALGM